MDPCEGSRILEGEEAGAERGPERSVDRPRVAQKLKVVETPKDVSPSVHDRAADPRPHVEQDPLRGEALVDSAQGVHDALGRHSSE